jgi:hypothetical protein
MNDTERDLRELFEAKARDAGSAPPVKREVLRRGRRRQVGTVVVAGVTALAVAAVALVSLQALHRADTSVPGGSTGNPAFTATIQNFTIAVPTGWTLIDRWPVGSIMAADSTSTRFSCVGTPIEAGSGNNDSSSSSDCTDQQAQTPEPPTIPRGGLPMLTLSNDDPGLGGSVCNADGSLPAGSATLYIGLDYAVTQSPDWQSTVPAWPDPLGNVLRNDLPPDQMPCGPGGYARFQTGGMPYIAWAGFGSDVTDADQQAIVDAFNGMRVRDAEISGSADETPGYVLAGGTRDAGPSWSIEVRPAPANVDMGYREPDGRATGVGDFTVPDVPIEIGGANSVIFGAVTFDAERVELRPTDGSPPIPGDILQLPDALNAPFDAFVLPNAVPGEVVAIGPDGDLGSASVGGFQPDQPSVSDRRAQSDLRNAYVAAKTYYTDSNSFEGFTPAVASSIEPSLDWQADLTTPGKVSIRDVGADHILLVTATSVNDAFCIAEQPDGTTTYGAIDAQNVAECVGGEVAWGQGAPPTETPTAVPGAKSTVNLEGFPSPATLTVNAGGNCLSIEMDTGSSSFGVCPHMSNHAGAFATIMRAENGTGLLVLVGFTSARAADRVFLIAADGARTQAPILYTLDAALDRQYFAFPVETTSGTLHIEDVNGNQLTAPIGVEAS